MVITLAGPYRIVACPVEVGVPFSTKVQGDISEERAQAAAASAADEAARLVLADPTATMMSAILCRHFREKMRLCLNEQILGARVSDFQTAELTPTHWP